MHKYYVLLGIALYALNGGCSIDWSGSNFAETDGMESTDSLGDGAAPSSLTVNGIASPVDLDLTPRFGWHVNLAEQTAYEIRVSSTRTKAKALDGDVWTSGKVASNKQNDIRYGGPELASSERYFWIVRTWGANDKASGWSRVAFFVQVPARIGRTPGCQIISAEPSSHALRNERLLSICSSFAP